MELDPDPDPDPDPEFDDPLYCPYCGEEIDIHVDAVNGSDSFVEDCYVCCRPILIQVECDEDGFVSLFASRESD